MQKWRETERKDRKLDRKKKMNIFENDFFSGQWCEAPTAFIAADASFLIENL